MTINEIEAILAKLEITIRGNVNQNEFHFARNAYTALRLYADYKQEVLGGEIKVDTLCVEKLNDF